MTWLHHPACFALIAAAQLLLALGGFTAAGSVDGSRVLPVLIGLGLAFDNAVIAAGAPLQRRSRLLPMSRWRYGLHAVVTPLLLPLSLLAARQGGLDLPLSVLGLGWLLALLWVVASWGLGFRHLDLVLQQQGSVLRHHNEDRTGQPGLRLALVALVLLILWLGLLVPEAIPAWSLRLGATAMLVGALLARRLGLAIANLGELVLMGCFAVAIQG